LLINYFEHLSGLRLTASVQLQKALKLCRRIF